MHKSLFYFLYISIVMGLAFMIASLTHIAPARAEYRAYELTITQIEKGTTRTVLSVLDHMQYPTYYPLNKNEIIQYVDSWMCYENMSNFRPICAKPIRDVASPLLTNPQSDTPAAANTSP